ncbi:hypothetical protein PENSPDRAFT_670536 [Peniophora sp. CONT]|nr:hypothetical protein PENSPDRAFT_670536 [Peniophora sp. CONT]
MSYKIRAEDWEAEAIAMERDPRYSALVRWAYNKMGDAQVAQSEAQRAANRLAEIELELKRLAAELAREKDAGDARKQSLEATRAELADAGNAITARDGEIKRMKADLIWAKFDTEDALRRVRALELDSRAREEEIDNLRVKLKEAGTKRDELEIERDDLETDRDELLAKLEDVENQCDELMADRTDLEFRLEGTEASLAEAETEREEARSKQKDVLAELETECDGLRGRLKETETESNNMREELDRVRSAAAGQRADFETLVSLCQESDADLREADEKIKTLRGLANDGEQMRARVSELEIQVREQEVALSTRTPRVKQDARKAERELRERLVESEKNVGRQEGEIDRLKRMLAVANGNAALWEQAALGMHSAASTPTSDAEGRGNPKRKRTEGG